MFLQTANLEISHIPLKKRNTTKHYHIIGSFFISKTKIADIGKIDAPSIQIHGLLFSWLGTDSQNKVPGLN